MGQTPTFWIVETSRSDISVSQPPQGGIINYLETQGERPDVNLICPAAGTAQYGWSFCVQQELSTAPLNSNKKWLAGTANTELTGCTVLVVASSRGVYMVSTSARGLLVEYL
jgi:hypothetical protein